MAKNAVKDKTAAQEAPLQRPGVLSLPLSVSIAAAVIVLLHVVAALTPSASNWGFHLLGFYPLWAMATAVAGMFLFLVPSVQESALRILQGLPVRLLRPGKLVPKGLILAGFAALCWFGRERAFLLGDGYLITGTMGHIRGPDDIARLFKNEPFAGYLDWNVFQLLSSWNVSQSNVIAVQLISIAYGLGSVCAIFWLAKKLFKDGVDALLFGGFILAAAGTQLFFGYVENYAPLYFALLLFAASAVSYLRGGAPLLIPSIVYGAMFVVHFGMICLLPGMVFLWYQSWRKGKILSVPISIVAMAATAGVLLWLCGYTIPSFFDVFLHSEGHILPIATLTNNWQAYTLFSPSHAIDLANLHLLLSPFAAVLLAGFIVTRWKRMLSREEVWVFLSVLMLCGLFFTFVVNSDLGVSRDWDLLATFNLGAVLVAGYAWTSFVEQRNLRQRLMVPMIAISMIHSAAWIGINSSESRSIERFSLLQDQRFWGKSAVADACDVMAGYYRDRKDNEHARDWLERYLRVDSTNGRIWAAAAQIYARLGDRQNQGGCYEKAVAYGTKIMAVYMDLGIMYANQKRYDEAIGTMKKAIAIDSASVFANEYMGEYYVEGKKAYRDALPAFLHAITLDPTFARGYFMAGECYRNLGEHGQMKIYWEKYLRLKPDAPEGALIRMYLQEIK